MPDPSDPPPRRRVPVLIVEDEPVLRLDAISMVERAGFEAVEAQSVPDAIRLLEERPDIRLVYIDLDMPRGIRGIDIAAAIRDRWPPVEIVLTAAFVTADQLDLPARAEFFAKPIVQAEVSAAMRRLSAALA